MDQLSDVALIFAENKQIKTSKFLLANYSPVFYKMFTGNYRETRENTVMLKDDQYESFVIILQLLKLRRQKINITILNLYDLIMTVDKYEIIYILEFAQFEIDFTDSDIYSLPDIYIRVKQIYSKLSSIIYNEIMDCINADNLVDVVNALIHDTDNITDNLTDKINQYIDTARDIQLLNYQAFDLLIPHKIIHTVMRWYCEDNEKHITEVFNAFNRCGTYRYEYMYKLIDRVKNKDIKIELFKLLTEQMLNTIKNK